MNTFESLKNDILNMGLKDGDTLKVHSSMKAIGDTENGAETVLEAFIDVVTKNGLLVFPTHTWGNIKDYNNVFDPKTTPSCVGILPNLFMKRKNVIRSLHPTHSVAAIGKDAGKFTENELLHDTPCHREGCYGKLLYRRAKILLLGCKFTKNTFIHGVEEWCGIKNRLCKIPTVYKVKMPNGELFERTMHSHIGNISENYDRIQDILLNEGIAVKGKIGLADSYLLDCEKTYKTVKEILIKEPNFFA